MYWSDWGSDGRIEKAGMDGSQRASIVTGVTWPNGLSIDFDLQRLYWTDAGRKTIEHSDLHGGNRQVRDRAQRPARRKPTGVLVECSAV